jgi:hypothetical protein
MKKTNYSMLIMLFFFATQTLFAQTDRIGTAGANELLIPVGARGVAMGSSAVTSARGADAIFWNPANVARSGNNLDILASNMTYLADINVIYGAVAVKVGSFGALGFSIKSLAMDGILKTTVLTPDGSGQTFKPQHVVMGLTWAKELTDKIAIGLNVNYISETIDLVRATGLGFDFGVTYNDLGGLNGLDFGVALKNFGGDMKFDGSGLWTNAEVSDQSRGEQFYKIDAASFSLPTNFDIAFGYTLGINESNSVIVNAVYTNNNFYPEQYKFGAEYAFDNLLFVRAGYKHTAEYESSDVLYKFAAGLGINYNVSGIDLKFDYTFMPATYMNDTHLISVGLGI